jgi:hypothetical protein
VRLCCCLQPAELLLRLQVRVAAKQQLTHAKAFDAC